MIYFGFVLVTCLLVVFLAGLTLAFYTFLKFVERSKMPDKDLPFLSIVVPARNEEQKIGRCLSSLLAQDYPNFELVVIDDRSTDATGEIIQKFADSDKRVKFVQGKNLPEGWIGKCNALVHASAHASGEWLLFTDADTCHQPNSVRDSVSYALENKVDLISFVPVQELGSFWERVVMPTLLGSFLCGDPFHTVNDARNTRAYAYGQYILARASAYTAIGGHQAIRDEIVEDHALGRVMKAKGFKIMVGDGKDIYSVRMYTNLETLWQGWTKNLYSLIEARPTNLALVLTIINWSALVPFGQAAYVASMWAAGIDDPYLPETTFLVSLEMLVLMSWYKLTMTHLKGVGLRHFFLLPLGSLTVTALYLHSAYLVLTGTAVNWKGRQYRVNSSKTIETQRVMGEPLPKAVESD